MISIKKIPSIVFCLATALSASAQNYDLPKMQFSTFDIRDGLTSNEINVIAEDRDGFIWFATDDGLSRFDGHNFTTFRSSVSRPDFLGSNTIRNLNILGDNIILTSPYGVEFMDRRSQKVTAPDLGELIDAKINTVVHLNDHMLLLGSRRGLFEMNTKTSRIFQREYRDENGNNLLTYVRTIFVDDASNIWMGTWENGVFYIPCGSNIVMHLTEENGIPKKLFVSDFAQYGDRIYIGTWSNGIYILASDSNAGGYSVWHVTPEETGCAIIYSLEVDDSGLLWIGSATGVKVLSPEGNSLKPAVFASQDDKVRLEQFKEAKHVFKDSDGHIWISRNGRGAVVASRSSESVTKVDFNDLGYGFNEITSIYRHSKEMLWLGIRGKGLVMYDIVQKKCLEDNEFLRTINEEANSIVGFEYLPNRRKMLMATRYNGLYWASLDENNSINALRHIKTENGDIRNNFTNCTAKASPNNYWIGTNKGLILAHVSSSHKTGIAIIEPDELNKAISYGTVTSVMQAKNGQLWIGTSNKGLYSARYDYFNMKLTECKKYGKGTKDLADDNIQCLFQDSRSNIWIGTKSGGLYRFHQASDTFVRAAKSSLFPSDEICAITEDSKGDLWISTANGFLCYSMNHEVKTVFPSGFYLPGSVWNDGNTVIFGGYTGLTFCDTDAAVKGFDIKAPRITNISSNNSEVTGLELMPPFTEKIVLPHNQRNIALTFSSPGLEGERIVRYAYKLSRPDKDWNYVASNNRTVTYSNLSAGKYTFSVMASSRPGVWSSPTNLEIVIKHPLAVTWWAILIYIALLYIVYSYIRIMQNRQNELTRDIDTFRKELAIQSAPNISTDLDKVFIDKIVQIIEDHLADPEFNIETFNAEMNMSGSTLYRRIKSLTGMSPKEFARNIRFKYACKFLMEKSSNVSEVAYLVGFSNAKYFSQSFKKEFGVTPSQYIKQHKK